MLVISLEGCHGCGKTTLINQFRERGYNVMDEAFLDMPLYALHPQSLLMETTWICGWFERILKLGHQVRMKESEDGATTKKPTIFVTDRSPFTAVFYAKHGHLLEPIIRQQIKEVKEAADIEIVTVHITVKREVLWERIQERLLREPGRVQYREHERDWMEKVLDFYEDFQWDMVADNSAHGIHHTLDHLLSKVDTLATLHRAKEQLSKCYIKEASSPASVSTIDMENSTDNSDTEFDTSMESLSI